MIILEGKSVYHDICMGKLQFFQRKVRSIKRYKIDNIESELQRFNDAKEDARKQLQELYENAVTSVGEDNAAIFQIHEMMLDDLDYIESIENIINSQQINAEYAVGTTSDNFSEMFEAMDDAYMQGRAADIRDISERLIQILSGESKASNQLTEPVIIGADDLVPSETIQLDKKMVLGFLLKEGSVNSHTAILARSMGIPAVVSLGDEFTTDYEGKDIIIDGFSGKIYIEPDEKTLSEMNERMDEVKQHKEMLLTLKGKENETIDGKKIKIYANIGNTADLSNVLENDAGGIGLFRSEFLYLENDDFPTEEQQFSAYKLAAENMAGKQVIIRTLDLGADKQADYFKLDEEENPALGYRAIRICLTQTDIFKTQLRALYRASVFGNIAVMYPMITSVEELEKIKVIEDEVKKELDELGIPYKKDISTGIMIETPAAAVISDKLAKYVDFFSIGTNDLSQYTLAIDRQNQKLDTFFNAHHEAILRLIKLTVDNAHAAGIWAGICGELGADTELTQKFLQMGVDELSVSPSMILPVRQKVRETDLSKLD